MTLLKNAGIYCMILLLIGCSMPFAGAQSLKVLSYNIHHGADKDEINTLQEMGEFIKSSNADLVGLQEVDSICTRSGNVDQMKELAEITGMYYVFQRHFEYDGGAYGLGILSRFPITSQQNHQITSLKNGIKKSLALLSAIISLPDGNLGNTFPVINPTKKIDYILVSAPCLTQDPTIQIALTVHHSDHLPLLAELELTCTYR